MPRGEHQGKNARYLSADSSDAGPSLAFKTGFDGSLMVLGWTGLSGSAERQREVDNYLNIAFTGDFHTFKSEELMSAAAPLRSRLTGGTRQRRGPPTPPLRCRVSPRVSGMDSCDRTTHPNRGSPGGS